MADSPTDPRLPELLQVAHELSSPLSAVLGNLRMLLRGDAGPLSDLQRLLIQRIETSCGGFSTLVAEMRSLSELESRTAPFKGNVVNLHAILSEAIATLPELSDRNVTIDLTADTAIAVDGDAVRLRTAFSSILYALRREVVTTDQLLVRVAEREDGPLPTLCITIGEPIRIDALLQLQHSQLSLFKEWRGGNGMRLANARRVIQLHGGRLWSPAEDSQSSAIVTLPRLV